MFKKKEAKEEAKEETTKPKKEEEQDTTVEEAKEINRAESEPKKELTEEEKKLLELINAYKKKYDNVYDANDFFGVSQTYVEAERLNLEFAIYSELVELKNEVRSLRENGKNKL